MKQWLKNLFSENSEVSMVRVMAFVSLLIGGYLAIIGKDACVSIFVGGGFISKVLQKGVELNSKNAKGSGTQPPPSA
jgi:hypothetical protein